MSANFPPNYKKPKTYKAPNNRATVSKYNSDA